MILLFILLLIIVILSGYAFLSKEGGDLKNLKQFSFNSVKVLQYKPKMIECQNAYGYNSFKCLVPTFIDIYSIDRKIQNIWLSKNKIAQLRLIYFLQKKSNFTFNDLNDLTNITDQAFLEKYIKTYPYDAKAEQNRGINKAKSIYDSFLKYQFETSVNHKITSIMDIACGEGYITDALGKEFNTTDLLGLEINIDYVTKEIKKEKAFSFMHYYALPECVFPNLEKKKQYDLIMIILGLHHFSDPGIILTQINDSISEGGLLLIRDHNIINCIDLMLVELEHRIPDFQRGLNGESWGCYRSSFTQDELLKLYGFELVYTNFLTEDKHNEIERNIHTTNINDRFYIKTGPVKDIKYLVENENVYIPKYVPPNSNSNFSRNTYSRNNNSRNNYSRSNYNKKDNY